MINDDWHALSLSCQFINSATLGYLTQSCANDSDVITFYQKDAQSISHDITIDFKDGTSQDYSLSEQNLFNVGIHNHYSFIIDNQINPPSFEDPSEWNYIHETVNLSEVNDFKIKGDDEVYISPEGIVATAFNNNEPDDDKTVLKSPYSMITIMKGTEKPGYPVSSYIEPLADIDVTINGMGAQSSFMKLYLNNGKTSEHPDVFTIMFDDSGQVNRIFNNAGESYNDWASFADPTHGRGQDIVNSQHIMHDIDLDAVNECLTSSQTSASNFSHPYDVVREIKSQALDKECASQLLEEINEYGDEYIHVGNFIFRSNDSTNQEEVTVNISAFDTGLKSNDEIASTVHQQNSLGIDNYSFDGEITTITFTPTMAPKVWLNHIEPNKTLRDFDIKDIIDSIKSNPGSYINIYLKDGNGQRCVTLLGDNKSTISKKRILASCKAEYTEDNFNSLDELLDATDTFTIKANHYDGLNKGNFFWRGKDIDFTAGDFTQLLALSNQFRLRPVLFRAHKTDFHTHLCRTNHK